jgi:hypothetical protein
MQGDPTKNVMAERYLRWQEYRINQLSFAINLFLSFAVASIGYAINLKLSSVHPETLTC